MQIREAIQESTTDSLAVVAAGGGRIGSTAALLAAAAGLILAVRAFRRSHRSPGRSEIKHVRSIGVASALPLVLGAGAIALGSLVAFTADGGAGTGNGVAGAILAVAGGALALLLVLAGYVRDSRTS